MVDSLKKRTRIQIRSTYAVGGACPARPHMESGRPIYRDVAPGTSLKRFLQDMPELGHPACYDDMMLHVFVNGRSRGFDYVRKEGDVLDLHLPSSGG